MMGAALRYGHMLVCHRALGEILVQRELKGRYRGTFLGFLWSFVSPLMLMVIYVGVFSLTMRVPVPNYPAFVLTGLLPWNCFTASMMEGMHAVMANGNLVKKVHLPAEIFPLVAVISNMAHFVFSLPVLLAVLVYSGLPLTPSMLLLPVLLVLQFLFSGAFALLLSSLAVQFRDLTHIVPNLVMMWFYLTPVVYTLEMVPPRLQPLMRLNPLCGLMHAYRAIFILGEGFSPLWALQFFGLGLSLFCAALWLFAKRRELYPELC
jgi:ABC-type polysaccharide/polyol phosphate export permease